MKDPVPQDVLDKARKLLNLKERAATEGEALAAAKALAKLVDKHRIEIAKLESAGFQNDEVIALEEDEPLMVYKRKTTWKNDLALTLCDHYGVVFMRRSRVGGKKKILLAGRKTDIEMVRYMFNWLSSEIERLTRASGAEGRVAINSWRIGFVRGLQIQLEEARKEALSDEPASVALVLRCRKKEADRWLTKHLGKELPTIKTQDVSVDPVWYEAGKKKGKVQHLGKSLEEGDA